MSGRAPAATRSERGRLVLHVHGRARWGGSVAHTLLVARELAARGAPVAMAGPADAVYRQRFEAAGIDYHSFDVSGKWDLGAPIRFKRLLDRLGPSVVHTHVRTADFCAGVGTVLASLSPGLAPRLVVTLHGAPNEDGRGVVKRDLPARLYAASMRRMPDRVLAVSEHLARLAEERLGIAAGTVRTIPNGVDVDALDRGVDREGAAALRRRLVGGDGDREPLVVVVASKIPGGDGDEKGHGDLVDALTLLRAAGGRPVVVALAGDGEGRGALATKVAARGLAGRVRLLGEQPPSRMPTVYAAADVAVLASHAEGLPRGLVEPMALGRAALGTAVGGIPELLDHGRAGALVPARRPGALAAALARLARSPSLVTDLGARGRARVRARYTLAALLDAHAAVYAELGSTAASIPGGAS